MKRGRGGFLPPHHRDKSLAQVVESLLQKGAIELAPLPLLGYYSRLFIVMKASGSWRPVMDLSPLNLFVFRIHHPEGCVRKVYQFQALLWSLCGSAGLDAGHGIWLIQASFREQVLLSLRTVLQLFNYLGVVVN